MKKHHKRNTRKVRSHSRGGQPKWLRRILALFAVVVLISGFGAICVYFVHSSAAVLGAHIAILTR